MVRASGGQVWELALLKSVGINFVGGRNLPNVAHHRSSSLSTGPRRHRDLGGNCASCCAHILHRE